MKLLVYNGEHFIRGRLWHILASIFFLLMLFLTLYGAVLLGGRQSWLPGWTDIVSALLFLAMCAAYRFYVRQEIAKIIELEITDDALRIDDKYYQWHAVQGFSLESRREDSSLYSIVFVINHHSRVHTLADEKMQVIDFVNTLKEYTTFIPEVSFGRFEKLLRRLKI